MTDIHRWFSSMLAGVILFSIPLAASAASMTATVFSSAGTLTASTTVTVGVSTSGLVSPTYSVSDSYVGTGATRGSIDSSGYFTWTPTIYDGGVHVLTFFATDDTKATASTTLTLTVMANTVLAQNLAPSGGVVAAGRTVTFTAYAPGFIDPQFSVYDTTWNTSVSSANIGASSGAFSWTPSADDLGAHTIMLQARDPYGHTAQAVVPLTVLTPKVTVQSYPSYTLVGSLASFVATVSGMTSPKWSLAAAPLTGTTTSVTAAAISPAGVFSWIPLASDLGAHAITVIATDPAGNLASTTVTLNVTVSSVAVTQPSSVPVVTAPTTGVASPKPPTTVPAASSTSPASTTNTGSVLTVPPTAPTNAYKFTSYLTVGSRTAAVTALQRQLTALDLYSGPITGYFGPMTAAAVRKFQAANGIDTTGGVGPLTRTRLNSL